MKILFSLTLYLQYCQPYASITLLFQQREVKLSRKDSSCVINNCLPGTTHFVRLVALDIDNQIMEKSKQMTIQTSAPPDSPALSVR